NPKLESKVLDMCCAPGGKLTHLAALMQNTGTLIGNEVNTKKNKLIEENISRLGVTNCKITNFNGVNFKEDKDFDYILLDAPCSGIRVMKSKPEIRLKKPQEVLDSSLIQTQYELLKNAAILLAFKGYLVYSTCTINKDENTNQIKKFLKEHKNFEVVEEHQFFGYEYNTDGFYICKLQKKG